MAKRFFLFIVLLLTANAFANGFKLIETKSNELLIEFESPEIKIDNENNLIFDNNFDKKSFNLQKLPIFSKFIENVDENSKINYTILKQTKLYSATSKIVSEKPVITLSKQQTIRTKKVNQLKINPFWQKNNSVYYANKIKISIEKTNNARTSNLALSNEFSGLYSNLVLNPSSTRANQGMPGAIVYVYRSHSDLNRNIDRLIDFRKSQGYTVYTIDASVYTNSIEIKNQIQQIYNDNKDISHDGRDLPEFICLIGDTEGDYRVPYFNHVYGTEEVASDYDYTLLDGNDDLPDASIGRLSFSTTLELKTMIRRIYEYESQQEEDNRFVGNTLLVGDDSDSGISTIAVMKYIKDLINDRTPGQETTEVYHAPYDMNMIEAVNSGVHSFYYRGFYGVSGFDNQAIDDLYNSHCWPVVSLITCHTGKYADFGEVSVIEKLIRTGSPVNPTGAIAAIGSSSSTHTCFNNIITGGIALSFYYDKVLNVGHALNRGKVAMYYSYPADPAESVSWYLRGKNLMGDPATKIIVEKPKKFNVELVSPVTANTGFLKLRVFDEETNQGIAGAVATAKINETYASGLTDENGYAILSFDAELITELEIYANKSGYYYVKNTVNVNAGNQQLKLNNHEVAATTGANSFELNFANASSTTSLPTTVTISSLSNGVQITSNTTFSIPAVNAGQNHDAGNLSFNVSGNAIRQHLLKLEFTNANSSYIQTIQLNVQNTKFELVDFQQNYTGTNQAEFNIEIKNLSSSLPINVKASVSSSSNFVNINQNQLSFSSFAALQSNSSINSAVLNFENSVEAGQEIPIEILIENTNDEPKMFSQTINTSIYYCPNQSQMFTGADEYGYRIYNNNDIIFNQKPQYTWFDINPANGGNGIDLAMIDEDNEGSGDFKTITVPFAFRFYGKTYRQLTISSNGYLMPGIHTNFDWMNYSIPGPMVPRPIIAAFWDDLITINDGKVFWYYDESNKRLIVQWDNMKNRYDRTTPETFQAIIYAHEQNNEIKDFSRIEFMYNTFNNVDAGNYGDFYVDHGEYVTIGVADCTGEIGVEYTHANIYTENSNPLTNESALAIERIAPIGNEIGVIFNDISLKNADNEFASFFGSSETAYFDFELVNLGVTTANNVTVTLTSTDERVVLANNTVNIGSLNQNQHYNLQTPLEVNFTGECEENQIFKLIAKLSSSKGYEECDVYIKVLTPDVKIADFAIVNNNGGFLLQNETSQVKMLLEKVNEVEIESSSYSISLANNSLVFSPENASFTINENGFAEIIFDVSCNSEFYDGEVFENEITFTLNGLPKTKKFNLVYGSNINFKSISFDNFDPDFFDAGNSVLHLRNSAIAGGEAPEVEIISFSNNDRIIKTELVDTVGVAAYSVKFKQKLFRGNVKPNAGVFMNGKKHKLWEYSPNNSSNEAFFVYVCDDIFDQQIKFYFEVPRTIDSETIASWFFDDIEINQVNLGTSTITGTLQLEEGFYNQSETYISYSNKIETQPDENGNYTLTVPATENELKISARGYLIHSQTLNPVPNQTIEVNPVLTKLDTPNNLNLVILDEDSISIRWDYNSNLMPEPDYYRLIREFNFTNNTTVAESTRSYDYYNMPILPMEGYIVFKVAAGWNTGDESFYSEPFIVRFPNVDASDEVNSASFTKLHQNTPNPFNPITEISFDINKKQNVTLCIYNIKGQLVKTLVNGKKEKGKYTINWNGTDKNNKKLASGVYFIKLSTEKQKQIKKAVLLK